MPMTIKLDRRSHINFWSSGLVTNVRPYACTCVISMTTKLDKVVTCDGGFEGHLLIMWSRDKRKNIYLNFHDTYGHQTWQSGNLWSEDLTHYVTWPFDHMVPWQI